MNTVTIRKTSRGHGVTITNPSGLGQGLMESTLKHEIDRIVNCVLYARRFSELFGCELNISEWITPEVERSIAQSELRERKRFVREQTMRQTVNFETAHS